VRAPRKWSEVYKRRIQKDPNYNKKLHARYRESRNSRARVYDKGRNLEAKRAVFAIFGDKCVRCAFADPRALQLDHIHRAREKRGKAGRSGSALYRQIMLGQRNLSDFQLLCANCNAIKKIENDEIHPVERVTLNETLQGELRYA